MAHPQQIKFMQLVKKYFLDERHSPSLGKRHILEIGSYDVNGSIRSFLEDEHTEYVGVDLCEGKGVDMVCYGHALNLPDERFDVALSCECFEHDSHWASTFKNMCRMTKAGGVIAFTCASLGRVEHGTVRSNAEHSPGTQFMGLDYYKNLSKEDFYSETDIHSIFSEHYFFFEESSYDLYFVGVKKGENPSAKPLDNKPLDNFYAEIAFQNFACAYLNKVRPFRAFVKKIGRGF